MPFSIFMRRTLANNKSRILGWERRKVHCTRRWNGRMDIQSANEEADKDYLVKEMKKSSKCPNGSWHSGLLSRRDEIKRIIEDEPGSRKAQALRSLSLDNDKLSIQEFAEKIVHEFLSHTPIKFVRYNEGMYDFMKDGETTRGNDGQLGKDSGKPPAKAADWYTELARSTVIVKREPLQNKVQIG
jgi:hypothetical protein